MKKALVVGIDAYPRSPLQGCVNDAIALAQLLERNGDGAPNFDVRLLTSNDSVVDNASLSQAVSELFKGEADTALFYFAGHGIINADTNVGTIVSVDGRMGSWGLSLVDLLSMANNGYPRIKSTVLILDCCHSGFAGEVPALGNPQASLIGTGVTILTASHREGVAVDGLRHGIFTDILLDGLGGGCSDICGNITPASLYSHVDQTLGPWEQRPIYKANVQTFVTLRQVTPKIPLDALRQLPIIFPTPGHIFSLDPSFEPDRQNVPDWAKSLPINEDNVRIFRDLQRCNRHGLVVPIDEEHMYYAAINSKGCKLTALGAHYRKLVAAKRL